MSWGIIGMARALGFVMMALFLPIAAHAADPGKRAFTVPEPSDIALLAAGVAGLVIGRRSSRSRRRDD